MKSNYYNTNTIIQVKCLINIILRINNVKDITRKDNEEKTKQENKKIIQEMMKRFAKIKKIVKEKLINKEEEQEEISIKIKEKKKQYKNKKKI